MLIAEIRRKLSDLEDLDGDDGDSIGRVRSLLSSSKEDLLTADVFGAVKYLPRRPYLAAVLDGIAQRNQSCPEFACHNAQLHVGEDDFQFNFWPTYRNPTGLPGNMTEPDVELLCPSTRIFVEAKLGAGFGSLQIPRQLLIGLQQDDGREFFLVLGHYMRKPIFTKSQILAWADEHHTRTGSWPTLESGEIPGTDGETWYRVDYALRHGLRGMRGGSSLAKLIASHHGLDYRTGLRPLTKKEIIKWARAHRHRTGRYPRRHP